MKKTIRFISLFLAIAISLSLCGCVSLDELRATSGILTKDGIVKLYDGTEYKRLDNLGKLSPYCDLYDYVDIVKEEVPLLLVFSYSKGYFLKGSDGNFLVDYDDNGNEIWYCRSDIYDSVIDHIENGFVANKYCYPYFDYEKGESHRYVLTESQANAITQVKTSQEPETRSNINYIEYDYYVDLYLATEDLIFMENTIDIGVINGNYYIIDDEKIHEFTGDFYRVPDELLDVFYEIIKKQIECDEYWDKYE